MTTTTFNHLSAVKKEFERLANSHNEGYLYFEEYLDKMNEVRAGNSYQRLPQKYRESAENYGRAIWQQYHKRVIYAHVYRTAEGPKLFPEYNDIARTEGEFNQEYYITGFFIYRQWLMKKQVRAHSLANKDLESLPVVGLDKWREKQIESFSNGKITW